MGLVEGKVAIVTGSGRGIGKGTAMKLASEGASVVVNDIDADVGREAVDEITAAGGKAAFSAASVSSSEDAQKIIQTAIDSFGKLDFLVNNAGITRDSMFHKLTDELWDMVMDTHLKGAFNCTRAAAPYMRDAAKKEMDAGGQPQPRKIINVTSLAYLLGNPGQANYAAAKGGIVGLSRVLSSEWARFQINVNVVAPGFIDTRMTQAIPDKLREKMIREIPLGRAGTPEDVANAVLFLCSSLSDYITGQILCVNGGVFKL